MSRLSRSGRCALLPALAMTLALSACAQGAPAPATKPHTSGDTPAMTSPAAAENLFDLTLNGLNGQPMDMSAWQGRPVLVVNTASKCGFTPQYKGLQALWTAQGPDNLLILGVPSDNFGGQEFAQNEKISEFCEINYGVTFPLAARADVVGANAHPAFALASARLGEAAVPKWNFHKVLFNARGEAVAAFPSSVKPDDPALLNAIAAAR